MSFFIRLVELTDAERRELENVPKIHAMIQHGLKLDEYRRLLHNLYHIVWHFCPVMAAAAARCDDRFREVRYDLYERIEEEKGHDAWVLEDIEALGGDVREAREKLPSAPAFPPSAPPTFDDALSRPTLLGEVGALPDEQAPRLTSNGCETSVLSRSIRSLPLT